MTDQPKTVAALGGRTFAELEVARHESGRLMFAGELRRVDENGVVRGQKIRICVPTPADQIEARVRARALFRSKKDLDPERDKDLFDELEQICLLSVAVRTYEPPHSQFAAPEELAQYDEGSLRDLLERINALKSALDPRVDALDDGAFWELVVQVAESGTLYPLAGIDGRVQRSSLVRMAREALASPTGRSFAQSRASSTPEP